MYNYQLSGCISIFFILLFALAIFILIVAAYYVYYLYDMIKRKNKEKDLMNPQMGEVYKICPYCNASVKVTAKTCPNCNHALN